MYTKSKTIFIYFVSAFPHKKYVLKFENLFHDFKFSNQTDRFLIRRQQ